MSTIGYKHTDEAKIRIGAASRGKKCAVDCECWKHSPETRAKQAQSHAGRKFEKCAAGCSCWRHQKRRGCIPGCTCGRHKVSEATRAKLRASVARRTPEQEARRIEAARKATTGNKWAAGVEWAPERKERFSKAISEHWLKGTFDHKHPCWGRAGVHAGVKMRCLNSEGVFARDLDEAGISWEYEPRRFKLSWCTYKPDFYLPDFDIWVEVKGYPEMPGNWKEKVAAFRQETGKCLVVVFMKELSTISYGGE